MITLVLIVSNNLRNCVKSKMVTLVLIVRYACMVFHVRLIFLAIRLRIPHESLATRVGFGDKL